MNQVRQTNAWLSNNHIKVSDDWLQACVEWIQEENQGRNLSADELNTLVYEQWLLSDLHELEVKCLPSDVISAAKFELTGTYALQVDSILDVGLSFYSQQQRVKGTENANAKVSAEEPTYKPWEQKPSRMLMMKLTDGKQVVQGMEYKPISCLSAQSLPGTKVLIHGQILCRYGVLMLSEANIKNLGGEVDTLVEANTVLNTLQSAMEASSELAKNHHRQEFEGSSVRKNKVDIKPSQQTSIQGGRSIASQGTLRQSSGNFVKPKTEIMSQRNTSSYGNTSSQINISRNVNNNFNQQNGGEFDDNFMDDIDFDDDFEETCMQKSNGSSKNRNSHPQHTSMLKTTKQSTLRVAEPNQGKTKQKPNNKNIPENRKQEKHTDSRNSSLFIKNETVNVKSAFEDDDFMDFEDDDIDLQAIEEVEMRNENRDIARDTSSAKNTKSLSSSSSRHEGNIKGGNNDNGRPQAKIQFAESLQVQTGNASDQTLKREAVPVGSRSMTEADLAAGKVQKIKEEQRSVLRSQEPLDIENGYPYTYLSKILSAPYTATPTYHTVKAYIATLTGKLSSQDNRWTLCCKINDGTMAVDVDLSTQVLTEMIGFSPQEAQEMKKRIARDPSVKGILKEGLQQCQQKLIELLCLMEIEVSSNNPRPVIVATKQLTSHNTNMLYQRVMTNWSKLN